MNSRSFFRVATIATALCVSSAIAADEGWTTDFEAAKAAAAAGEKDLLINFTGSDWCGWCLRLKQEVFQHQAFKAGTADRFVLVEMDFPHDQSKLSAETAKQNQELQQKYGVANFPTVLLADAKGRPFARTGHLEGGAENYLDHLRLLTTKKADRDLALQRAEQLEGAEKVQAMVAALKGMELEEMMIVNFYGDVIARIAAVDPSDESGFIKGLEDGRRFADFEAKLAVYAEAGDHDAALSYVLTTLEAGTFEGEKKQQVILVQGMIYAEKKEFDASIAALRVAKATAPESELAGRIDAVIAGIEEARNLKEAEGTREGADKVDLAE